MKPGMMASGNCLAILKGDVNSLNGRVICGEVLSDGATLVSATADKEVKVWDLYLSNDQCTNTFSSHNHCVSVMIEVGRGIIATAFSNKIIRIWDITTGEEGKIFVPPTRWSSVVEEKDSSRALNLTLTCIWWSDEEVIY